MELIRKGKVKEVYAHGPDELLFRFTDQISVFDKIIPTLVPKKGETLNRTSAFWFKEVEKLGLRTHFKSLRGPNEAIVKRVRVIPDYDVIAKTKGDFLIPLEVICRHYLAGSMVDRLKSGEVKPETLGFPAGSVPRKGAKLPKPFIEFTTKLEKVDRDLTEAEAQKISGLSDRELEALKDAVLRIDARIQEVAGAHGLIHVDGKKEFAFDADRRLMLVDTFGTPDEDRWWDAKAYEAGELVELSKEHVRAHYRATGYHEKLMAARKAKQPEPDIPALPAHVTREVTDLYVGLYERITGQKF
ncbi:MAG TPA: phosphoribosylaminoimidazolesuccinocarboxamide synthase [Candidatus Thermoplasmatota archaeon]|nr:phosphoribosylaminoimidazolesuccinocarboxamide synthase [Candidatus Thermoplasmatota archaeon]